MPKPPGPILLQPNSSGPGCQGQFYCDLPLEFSSHFSRPGMERYKNDPLYKKDKDDVATHLINEEAKRLIKVEHSLCIFIRAVALNIAKRKMEGGKIWVYGVLVSLVLMSVAGGAEGKGLAPCNFPAVYNFGDSNSDTGAFSATASPTQLPDGQTFFGKPAGRGCDGRLIIDFIAEELGIPYLSPYLDSVGSNFSHGANFAYGGATILRQTWQSPGIPFHLAVQATQFSQFKARTIDIYNQGKNTSRFPRPEDFSKALYTLDIGQNDVYTSTWSSNPLSIIPDLIDNFTQALQTLYDQGGRAFWIHNVGPNGCLPGAQNNIWNRTQETFDKNGCINSWNERVVEFNRQLKDRVIKLRAQLPEAAITYVDVYTAKYNLISNAKNLVGATSASGLSPAELPDG
ncbi:hypothetical protein RHSIM_RhsimUnG0005100 [Rhododendron simsii]|uniref:Uncharacterized protein n=1 Tax=Rhododendron simsii TaxID=118357 RepID=A0A834L5X1_RHOSS|nr:hypothetical protein RHSIM_RhsimUnG0005100 [Rhododendron simsii]